MTTFHHTIILASPRAGKSVRSWSQEDQLLEKFLGKRSDRSICTCNIPRDPLMLDCSRCGKPHEEEP